MSEVQAAIERYRRIKAGEKYSAIYPEGGHYVEYWMPEEKYDDMDALAADRVRLEPLIRELIAKTYTGTGSRFVRVFVETEEIDRIARGQ